jgi:putative ABC transport system ATP-binding protein
VATDLAIAVRDLEMRLGPVGIPVLDGVSLSVFGGEFVAVMGRSGAGKSTLLYCLSGLERPTSGTVHLAGRRIDDLTEEELVSTRRAVGFVFQQINLLPHLTLLENVALAGLLAGDRAARRGAFKRARDLLSRVGLDEAVDRRPASTSGGQQQRAAVARALIADPVVLFADEPTGALDSASGREVLDLLDETNRAGQTIIMATHDPKAAARAGRLVYMSDGRVHGEIRLDRSEEPSRREARLADWLAEAGA